MSDRDLRLAGEADRKLIRKTHSGEADVLDEHASRVCEEFTLADTGLTVHGYFAESDGAIVVEVEGPGDEHLNDDGSPRIRLWINDDLTYDGVPA